MVRRAHHGGITAHEERQRDNAVARQPYILQHARHPPVPRCRGTVPPEACATSLPGALLASSRWRTHARWHATIAGPATDTPLAHGCAAHRRGPHAGETVVLSLLLHPGADDRLSARCDDRSWPSRR